MNLVERLIHESEGRETKIKTANVALTPSLMDELDRLVIENNFRSRSELIHQALLYYIHSKLEVTSRE